MDLRNKTALVTGAARGIGRETARCLASEGAAVVCGDIDPAVDDTVKEIEGDGGTASAVVMDVRLADDWARAVASMVATLGRIDILANIAGVIEDGPGTVCDMTEECWDQVIAVDLKGSWLGMRAAIPEMVRHGGGRIVNIASMASLRGLPNMAAYSAAKGGVAALTRQAAVEYAPQGVLVNALAPGAIDTPILDGVLPELMVGYKAAHALNRLGTTAEVAGVIAFLCSDAASFITGQVIPVDGGWSAK